MAELPLTRGLVAIVDGEMLEFLSQWKWSVNEKELGRFYVFRSIHGGKKHVALHVQVLERALGRTLVKGEETDHKNRNPLDNRAENLRVATSSQNKANRAPRGRSQWKGVGYQGPARSGGAERSRPWFATVKGRHLGYFSSEREAAYAYNEEALKVHGEFAYLNQVFANVQA